jgi:hypothetical protein
VLVSLHLPKTAGTSFLLALEAHFGERLLQDYGDSPINKVTARRNSHALYACALNIFSHNKLAGVECIHGHFLPLKYRCLAGAPTKQFVTWMRDPLERLVSHYHYWQRSFDAENSGELHRRVVEEQWTLERFCLGPELQNIYSKFLWGFPLSQFSFIGITEHYESDIRYFSEHFLHTSLGAERINVSPPGESSSLLEDPDFRQRVAGHHRVDMALYQRALAGRAARLSAASVGSC